ncbi:MAG: hypothetical protein LBI33_02755 [Propionibacteriaceae bacterium]|jgi:hypothetical protein|nr:hypothetical protein [Propionibacteriaceae bacterium]
MAYKVARIQLAGWRDKFKDAEDDISFDADAYPDLDDYLCTMEQRGWVVVDTAVGALNTGFQCMYITLHRPES